ncbi:hypothetical protein NMY22_g6874 [Coprinellus aureogranulatus]|nr:hypothetical protein NMY22_g6874 [Coprinellus aureogranulatus]
MAPPSSFTVALGISVPWPFGAAPTCLWEFTLGISGGTHSALRLSLALPFPPFMDWNYTLWGFLLLVYVGTWITLLVPIVQHFVNLLRNHPFPTLQPQCHCSTYPATQTQGQPQNLPNSAIIMSAVTPPPVPKRPLPELPPEIHGEIIQGIDTPQALRHMGLVSREFNAVSRRLAFQTIAIPTTNDMVALGTLLSSPHCTIPTRISTFIVFFERLLSTQVGLHSSNALFNAVTNIFNHFHVELAISFDFPWTISRFLTASWLNLHGWSNLRRFIVNGTYTHLPELTATLSHMPFLDCLVVGASYKNEPSDNDLLASSPWGHTSLSTNLTELSLFSPDSLGLLRWMSSLSRRRRPRGLHVVRMKVDNRPRTRYYFEHLSSFLQRYGSQIAHLYISFEQPRPQMYRVLADALGHATGLRQLELFLPDRFLPRDVQRLHNIIQGARPSLPFRIRSGFSLGLNEAELREEPAYCHPIDSTPQQPAA